MNAMQDFYLRLFSTHEPYWIALAHLTRLNLAQIKSAANDLIWSIWD